MGSRLQLQAVLETLGTTNVYFQPPASFQMKYPCIVYGINGADTKFASNKPYINQKRYSLTVIDKDPDSPIPDRVAKLPMCQFERAFQADNLNHTLYNLYF